MSRTRLGDRLRPVLKPMVHEPMRVLHVTSGNMYGGIETMLVTIASNAVAVPELESHFAVCFEGRLRTELENAGAVVHDLGAVRARNPFSVLRARRVLSQIIARERIDVVICHSDWPLAVFGSAASECARPLVLWRHSADIGASWLERWARRSRPGLVIFNSEHTARLSADTHTAIRTAVLHCPVTFRSAEERTGPAERESVRREFGAGKDDVVIVQVSRLEAWKGQRLHLEALARLREVDNWICWVVGGVQRPSEQELYVQLERDVHELGISDRVRFLGQRTDVPRILDSADIFCQPNISPEPFGISFVEALSAELPVVSTAMGGAVEIVDASCGLLVSQPDPDLLAGALESLILDEGLRRRLGTRGPMRARSLCDPAQQLRRLCSILSRDIRLETASA